MKIIKKYRAMALGASWSFLFAFVGVASVVTVHCFSDRDDCRRESISALWGDAAIGFLVLLTATAAESRLPHDCSNKDSQTSEKLKSEDDF